MKIAVAGMGENVAQHFGHCEGFYIYEAENGKLLSESFIANPGHKPGFLPNFLHEKGVTTIISGGMGQGAVEIFDEHGIEVVVGASGEARAAADAYVSGALKSTGSICDEHHFEGECND